MTVQELLVQGYKELKEAQIESYMLDVQLILAHVLKTDKLSIILNRDKQVEAADAIEYKKLINLRKNSMPVKYITGRCEFMGLEFNIRQGVLIPRPDTEILVETVLRDVKEQGLENICDVCCGSGAIGLSIAKLTEKTKVELYDISDTAVELTQENAALLEVCEKVEVVKSDLLQWAFKKSKSFQVIVSNPPYIKEEEIPKLMKDVRDYEPHIALSGGKDGLDFYRRITEESVKLLEKGGLLAYEIGFDEGEAVRYILESYGFKDIECIKDLSGYDRVIKGYSNIN